jgi:hypothetical protein
MESKQQRYNFTAKGVRLAWGKGGWMAQQLPHSHFTKAAKKEINARLHAAMRGLGMLCPAGGCGWGGC